VCAFWSFAGQFGVNVMDGTFTLTIFHRPLAKNGYPSKIDESRRKVSFKDDCA
jgi:hypothetical protein